MADQKISALGEHTSPSAADKLAIVTAGVTKYIQHSNLLNIASQAEMETATSIITTVAPGRVHNHPGVAKAWGYITLSGGTPSLVTNYGIASIVDNGVGNYTLNWDTDFSSIDYSAVATVDQHSLLAPKVYVQTRAVGSIVVISVIAQDSNTTTNVVSDDSAKISVVAFGDQ